MTGLDGSGSAEFDVFDATENATLGCSASVACSLVAVPIMGVSCDADVSPAPSATDLANCEAGGSSSRGTLAGWKPADFPYNLTVSGASGGPRRTGAIASRSLSPSPRRRVRAPL